MKRSNVRGVHSGFAQFADRDARDRFVQAVLDCAPSLKQRAYLSGTRPTIVFEKLTLPEKEQIIAALPGLGRWFDDVQFQTMPGGESPGE
jgi:hypothetical protein